MPLDFAGAKDAATSNLPSSINGKSIFDLIQFILVPRDWSQSKFGNAIPMDHPLVLEMLELLVQFNAAGPIQFSGVEGTSGAQFQMDYRYGRESLKSLEMMDKVLCSSNMAIRLLVRGPFGVGTSRYHQDDLYEMYKMMAEAASGISGRPVIFKLFEAQNRPEEQLSSLRAITRLANEQKAKGRNNIQIELAVCYTRDGKLNMEYYEKIAQAILNNEIDPELIAGLSGKDMTGAIRPAEAKAFSKIIVTQLIAKEAKEAATAERRKAYAALHNHMLVHGVESAAEFVMEAAQAGVPAKADVMMGKEHGFPDFFGVREIIGKVFAFPLNERQRELAEKIHAKTQEAELLFDEYKKGFGLWSPAQMEYGRVPSGGAGAAQEMVVDKIATKLVTKGITKELATAQRFAADLFVQINGLVADDVGHAHSVTPGFLFLSTLTENIMNAMEADGEIAALFNQTQSIDGNPPVLRLNRENVDGSLIRMPSDKVLKTRSYYKTISNEEAMEYFRGRMPLDKSDIMGSALYGAHLEKIFQADKESSVFYKMVKIGGLEISDEAYRTFREALLADPTDSDKSKHLAYTLLAEMLPADFPDRDAFIQHFVARHVGDNEMGLDQDIPAKFHIAKEYVDGLEAKSELRVARSEALMACMTKGITNIGGVNVIHAEAKRFCRYFPQMDYLTYYPGKDIDWTAIPKGERILVQAMLDERASLASDTMLAPEIRERLQKEGIHTLDDLALVNPVLARNLSFNFLFYPDQFREDAPGQDRYGLMKRIDGRRPGAKEAVARMRAELPAGTAKEKALLDRFLIVYRNEVLRKANSPKEFSAMMLKDGVTTLIEMAMLDPREANSIARDYIMSPESFGGRDTYGIQEYINDTFPGAQQAASIMRNDNLKPLEMGYAKIFMAVYGELMVAVPELQSQHPAILANGIRTLSEFAAVYYTLHPDLPNAAIDILHEYNSEKIVWDRKVAEREAEKQKAAAPQTGGVGGAVSADVATKTKAIDPPFTWDGNGDDALGIKAYRDSHVEQVIKHRKANHRPVRVFTPKPGGLWVPRS